MPWSQALLGYLITAHPFVCVPAVIGVLACGCQTKRKKNSHPVSSIYIWSLGRYISIVTPFSQYVPIMTDCHALTHAPVFLSFFFYFSIPKPITRLSGWWTSDWLTFFFFYLSFLDFSFFFFFWFLVCYAATQLATQLGQRCIQVVRSNKEARKRLTESNGTPGMDLGHTNVVFQ